MYFPEIDGIRFLAILLVVVFHTHGYFANKTANLYPGAAESHTWLHSLLSKGDRGVELFFVLSGFILCMPFAHRYINNGKEIKLGKYYLRRVTRLEPPYILAITGIFILQLVTHQYPELSLIQKMQHYFASLTYTHGLIYHHTPIITVVAWSLEIEIQFYLMAPIFFKVLTLPALPRRVALLGFIAGMVLLQHFYMTPGLALTIYKFIQYFFVGILLADLYVSGVGTSLAKQMWVAPATLILLTGICVMPIKEDLYGQLLFPYMIGAFYLIVMRNDAIKSIFSYKFIPIIGGMCYTIYLLHYTIISAVGAVTLKIHLPGGYLPNLFFQLAILSTVILAISSIFYLNVERPFMDKKWMDKLSRKKKNDEINPVQ